TITSSLFKQAEIVGDLIPGGDSITATIKFSDDKWDMGGHPSWPGKNGTQTAIDFRNIADRWRDTAKDMTLLQLNPELAEQRAPDVPMAQTWKHVQEPISPVTAQANIKSLSHALKVIDQQQIKHFDSDNWSRLVVLLVQPADKAEKQAGILLSPLTGRMRAQQLITAWQVSVIGEHTVLFGVEQPFDGRETVELFGKKTKRLNAVRPHEAVGSYLGFAAWVIDNIADDIVTHIEWWAENCPTEKPTSYEEARETMYDVVADFASTHNGVVPGTISKPGTDPTLSMSAFGRLIGVYDADEAYAQGRWVRSRLKDQVTYSLVENPCPLPITSVPNIRGELTPWTDRLLADQLELDLWHRRLVYLVMYYLSATLMLRDSQLAVTPFDCITTETITRPNGTSYVKHTLSTYKTKNRHAPVPTTVTVNGRCARAIKLMQRLQQALGYEIRRHPRTGDTMLFVQELATPIGKKPHGNSRDELHLDAGFVPTVTAAAKELFDRQVIAQNLDGQKINMREVRITTAQAYAVREHGQALAAAFGQWDTAAVAAGYTGDVYRLITPIDPTETREIGLEDVGRRLVHHASARKDLTGNGIRRFDDVVEGEKALLQNPAPLTPARLKTLGKRHLNVEQGPLTLCIFQAEGAMCGGAGKPDFRLCLPGQCRNSVQGPADRARYELMRRQHEASKSEVLHRAAQKMHDANPDIAAEFVDIDDLTLRNLIMMHIDDYIRKALEN
ncbi:MAG: hypothetical protein HQ526_00620, partial [Actinobacteria bacterium]|nr:hypothetical protein [Actinomycetota bacterium]